MTIYLVMYKNYYIVAMKVNIFEAKARLSELVEAARSGQPVTICRRNTPVAHLVGVGEARSVSRPVGKARGQFVVPPAFFDALPAAFVETFYPAIDGTSGSTTAADGPAAPPAPSSAPRRRGGRR
jgi:prevent-host-death family protein